MANPRRISLRFSEAEYTQIKSMRKGKTVTDFFKELLHNAVHNDKVEANSFLELLKKLDSTDLSKLISNVQELKDLNKVMGQKLIARLDEVDQAIEALKEVTSGLIDAVLPDEQHRSVKAK